MSRDDIPRMQRFFEANPAYFRLISGEPAGPREAVDEFEGMPPPEWPLGRKWLIGFDAAGELAGFANVLEDLFEKGVWHVGLFIVDERYCGGGGGPLYRDLEAWMRGRGARWVRLGVVAGNDRAGRFWRRQGYREVRRREGFVVGAQANVLIVMAKPLDGGSFDEYAALVPRDRPDS